MRAPTGFRAPVPVNFTVPGQIVPLPRADVGEIVPIAGVGGFPAPQNGYPNGPFVGPHVGPGMGSNEVSTVYAPPSDLGRTNYFSKNFGGSAQPNSKYWTQYPDNPQAIGDPTGGVARTWDYQGVDFTIDRMRKMIYQSLMTEQEGLLRKYAENIVARVNPKDYLSEIAALYYFCLVHSAYRRDPVHQERLTSPLMMLQPQPFDRAAGRKARSEDCESVATLISSLCNSMGTPTEFCTISTQAYNGPFHHVFCVAKNAGKRIVLDPIPGPETIPMLQSVKRFQLWPCEPVRYSSSNGGWGIAGAPAVEGTDKEFSNYLSGSVTLNA